MVLGIMLLHFLVQQCFILLLRQHLQSWKKQIFFLAGFSGISIFAHQREIFTAAYTGSSIWKIHFIISIWTVAIRFADLLAFN